MGVYHLELYEITVGHTGVVCKFRGNPYQVFIDIPGGAAMYRRKPSDSPKVLFGGCYDPKEVIHLLKTIPMYNRLNTVFITENVVINYTKKFLRRSVEGKPGTNLPARKTTLVRFNRLPRVFVQGRREPDFQPPAWLF